MRFSVKNFKIVFNSYRRSQKITNHNLECLIAEQLSVSPDTIHKWHYGQSNPNDIDLIKNLAASIQISDYLTLLESTDGGDKMAQLTDRQLTALKKIYDICIWFLSEFNKSDGFNDYWLDFKIKGSNDPEADIYDFVEELLEKINFVLEQEYFDLHDTKVYDELCEYVNEDLVNIYDGKLSYAYRFEAIPEGHSTTSEDYDKAMIRLNSIIKKYV